MTPRVRFAPSPTGYLHIGGARTALFNWLYARRYGGKFILRIEDTDVARSSEASTQAILAGLRWLGLDWDEGPDVGGDFGPYLQMDKLPRYREVAEGLIAKGLAYRDYTSEDETQAMRASFAAERGLHEGDDLRRAGFKFRSRYRDELGDAAKPHVVRFRHDPIGERIGFDDLVMGRMEKPDDDFDDFMLLRADGVPLYNFGCVVDDAEMKITLASRGQEHINSTFPQILLYRALGLTPPAFAHLPLILGPDREKLSKRRHAEADVMAHKRGGILPHALLNFIARLGWSHGNQEIFTLDEMVAAFDFDGVGRSNGVWSTVKLASTNQHWMKATPPDALAAIAMPFLHARGVVGIPDHARLIAGLRAFAPRSTTLVELADKLAPYFQRGVKLDAAAADKHLTTAGKEALRRLRDALVRVADWTPTVLDAAVDDIATALEIKKGDVAQPARVALTGGTLSPGIGDTLFVLGRDESMQRIAAALGPA